MDLAVIITMGTVSLGGAMISKVLSVSGKQTEAQLVDMASLGMLGATAVGCVLNLVNSIRSL